MLKNKSRFSVILHNVLPCQCMEKNPAYFLYDKNSPDRISLQSSCQKDILSGRPPWGHSQFIRPYRRAVSRISSRSLAESCFSVMRHRQFFPTVDGLLIRLRLSSPR